MLRRVPGRSIINSSRCAYQAIPFTRAESSDCVSSARAFIWARKQRHIEIAFAGFGTVRLNSRGIGQGCEDDECPNTSQDAIEILLRPRRYYSRGQFRLLLFDDSSDRTNFHNLDRLKEKLGVSPAGRFGTIKQEQKATRDRRSNLFHMEKILPGFRGTATTNGPLHLSPAMRRNGARPGFRSPLLSGEG